ncbi:hydrogenase/urease accessory protein HupE [Paenibacillus cellulosilyticus]|uniref:Hydrogenase/urease accessory protein HupE n=1 Tax=Paenibacillus cellulosilyticus TaxID=375489 RepID=A0A2V2YPX9_9BACL|nr:HupE/UreJ family protein [Paenibacillus cellulosilyticus]PWV98505.1 hydrogenase/urease accessory protein HupE [Paenibacillus cellulosilyticus]QKS44114.1 HupE/UreJ family protein [Paenibacillus cellulosilyticus]
MSVHRLGKLFAGIGGIAALALAALSFPASASAHAYSASYTTLEMTKSGTVVTYAIDELSVIEWVGGDTNENNMLEPEEFEADKAPFAEVFNKNVTLKIGGQVQEPIEIENYYLDRKGDATQVIMQVRYPAPSGGQSIALSDKLYETDAKTNYVNLLTIKYGSGQSTAALSGGDRNWAMQVTDDEFAALPADMQDGQAASSSSGEGQADVTPVETAAADASTTESSHSATAGWYSFFKLGMHHILGGYDHLLFLFSLLIARQTLKQHLVMITAFTVAHSITLTLTVLGWISVPGSFVEPMIALSICYVAIDNMVRPQVSYRWMLTFMFGLIHGMGFADILVGMNIPRKEMGVDLVSFNLGIETVQLAIVFIALPLLLLLHRYKHSRKFVLAGSSTALLLGGMWLVERVFIG